MLLLDAENQYNAALAGLAEVLGYVGPQNFELIDEVQGVTPPSPDVAQLVSTAFQQRPEVKAEDLQIEAAKKLQTAAWEQSLPSIRALGVVGEAPIRDDHITPWYGAVGVMLRFRCSPAFASRRKSTKLDCRPEAEDERLIRFAKRHQP